MKDLAYTPYTELMCLDSAIKYIGGKPSVRFNNDKQEKLYEFWLYNNRELGILSEELRGYSGSAEYINSILKDSGFTVRLPEDTIAPIGGCKFATAGILDYGMKWVAPKSDIVECEGVLYDAVKLHGFIYICKLLGGEVVTIFETRTINNDVVYLTKDNIPLDYNLNNIKIANTFMGYTIIPTAHISHIGDVEWLEGLYIDDKAPIWIEKAVQESIIDINLEGIIAKSTTAVLCLSGCCGIDYQEENLYIVDAPYNIFITRPGLSKSIISAHIPINNWNIIGGE